MDKQVAILTLKEMAKGVYERGKVKDISRLYRVRDMMLVSSSIVKFFFQIYLVLKVDIDSAIEKVRHEMNVQRDGSDSRTPIVNNPARYEQYRIHLESTVIKYFSCRNQFTVPQLESVVESHLVEWVFCEIELQKLIYRKISREYTKARFEETFAFLTVLESVRLDFNNISFQALARKAELVVRHSPAVIERQEETVVLDEFNGFRYNLDSFREFNIFEKMRMAIEKPKKDEENSEKEQSKLLVKGEDQVITNFALTEARDCYDLSDNVLLDYTFGVYGS